MLFLRHKFIAHITRHFGFLGTSPFMSVYVGNPRDNRVLEMLWRIALPVARCDQVVPSNTGHLSL